MGHLGGLRAVVKGLQHSGRPCAALLSVAGFFAIKPRFLAGEGFILRVKRSLFPVQDPTMFNNPGITVIGSRHIAVHDVQYGRLGVQGGYVRPT